LGGLRDGFKLVIEHICDGYMVFEKKEKLSQRSEQRTFSREELSRWWEVIA
jgi:hypothetical protein